MKSTMKRLAFVATAVAASGIMFSPSAQADITTQDAGIPCGIYSPGDGLKYYGNCASDGKLVSISQPGLQGWTACVGAQSAILLGDGSASWSVRVIRSC